jgi:WD40 repeat protein
MSFFVAPPILAKKVDPAKAKLLAQLRHPRPLIGARFDPSGEYVFAGSEDNHVVRWHLASSKMTLLAAHKSWVRALAFGDRVLYSGDWAGRLIAWPSDEGTPTPKWNLAAHRGWLRALAVSPDGRTLASCGNDKLIKLWSIPDGKWVADLSGHESHVYNIAWHPSGKELVSADLMGNLKVWDVAARRETRVMDGKVLHKYDTGFGADIGGVRSMAFDAAGKTLACAGITNVSNAFAGVGNPLIVLFDFASGKKTAQLTPKVAFQGTMWGVAFHSEGWILGVAGGNGGMLYGWKDAETQATATLTIPNNARDLALHHDNKRVAIPCYDGVLRLYDLTGG